MRGTAILEPYEIEEMRQSMVPAVVDASDVGVEERNWEIELDEITAEILDEAYQAVQAQTSRLSATAMLMLL